MRFHSLVCAMALALAACATTATRDEVVPAGAAQSHVLIAVDGMRTDPGETQVFTFQRVDMASSTFKRELAYVRFGQKRSAAGGGELPKPETMAATSVRFAGTNVRPGDYALVSRSIRDKSIGYGNCYSRGAAIYRFREGITNIVRLGKASGFEALVSGGLNVVEVDDPAALQAQVAEVLAGKPTTTAPPAVARLLGSASFETGPNRNCNPTGGFSFSRAPGVSVDW